MPAAVAGARPDPQVQQVTPGPRVVPAMPATLATPVTLAQQVTPGQPATRVTPAIPAIPGQPVTPAPPLGRGFPAAAPQKTAERATANECFNVANAEFARRSSVVTEQRRSRPPIWQPARMRRPCDALRSADRQPPRGDGAARLDGITGAAVGSSPGIWPCSATPCLGRDHPDLVARVVSDELSANATAILLGRSAMLPVRLAVLRADTTVSEI